MKIFGLFTLILSFLVEFSLASVLAIDYGSDFIKASLIKPGVPFDVLLNKDSKRKIQASVAWKKSDRVFGTDAYNLASRFPSDSFSSLKLLQAAPYDSDAASYFASISVADIVETSRSTVGFRRSDGSEWTVEELIAMQFAYVKEVAEGFAGEPVHDVVVTVPPYYSQFERDAVVDAIEIAGLRTLALINDGTAVAVNYAMMRSFSTTPEYHVIYDAGASSIRATVVAFASGPESKGKSASTMISVAGVGYDRQVGGTELDRRLREILVKEFNTKHKKDIRKDKRGMAKLWKEAQRVKAILSANTDTTANVESLAFDIDFKAKVTRAAFEQASADLKPRYAKPILDAIASAGLTLDDITSVILTGGSSRTPMIQAAVKAVVGSDKISQNVNADEAAVLGAALHGASLSPSFKTKDIKITDITLHDVQVSYEAPSTKEGAAKPRTITTTIFPAGSKTGSKKTLTFKHQKDFAPWFHYKQAPAPGFPTAIQEVQIADVAEAIQNITELGGTDPVVKVTVSLSDSGFVAVKEAHVYADIKEPESIAGKLKGLFGGGSSSDSTTADAESTEDSETTATSEAPSSTPSADAKKAASGKQQPTNTISLTVTTTFYETGAPLALEEKRASRDRLRAVDQEEAQKRRKEDARNSLEGYLYRVRDLLEDESEESPFKKCSQDSERARITEKMEEIFLWMQDKADYAETSQFLDKRNSLEILEQPIIHRYREIEEFPQTLNNSQMWNWSTRLFLTEAKANMTEDLEAGRPTKYTKEELDGLEKTLKDHEAWLYEWVEKQKKVKFNEDPVIDTREMKARAKTLETHLQRLVRKKAPKPKKKSTSTTSAAPEQTEESRSAGADEPQSTPVEPPHDEL